MRRGIIAKKFDVPKNPLELELNIQTLQPTSEQEQSELVSLVDDILKETEKGSTQYKALITYKTGLLTKSLKNTITENYVLGFQQWLLGKGRPVDHDPTKTWWGRQSLADDPEVNAYVELFYSKMMEYKLIIQRLKNRRPVGIYECWIYYKYIVRQETFGLNSFLEDWELLKDQFFTGREKYDNAARDDRLDMPNTVFVPKEMAPYGRAREELAEASWNARRPNGVASYNQGNAPQGRGGGGVGQGGGLNTNPSPPKVGPGDNDNNNPPAGSIFGRPSPNKTFGQGYARPDSIVEPRDNDNNIQVLPFIAKPEPIKEKEKEEQVAGTKENPISISDGSSIDPSIDISDSSIQKLEPTPPLAVRRPRRDTDPDLPKILGANDINKQAAEVQQEIDKHLQLATGSKDKHLQAGQDLLVQIDKLIKENRNFLNDNRKEFSLSERKEIEEDNEALEQGKQLVLANQDKIQKDIDKAKKNMKEARKNIVNGDESSDVVIYSDEAIRRIKELEENINQEVGEKEKNLQEITKLTNQIHELKNKVDSQFNANNASQSQLSAKMQQTEMQAQTIKELHAHSNELDIEIQKLKGERDKLHQQNQQIIAQNKKQLVEIRDKTEAEATKQIEEQAKALVIHNNANAEAVAEMQKELEATRAQISPLQLKLRNLRMENIKLKNVSSEQLKAYEKNLAQAQDSHDLLFKSQLEKAEAEFKVQKETAVNKAIQNVRDALQAQYKGNIEANKKQAAEQLNVVRREANKQNLSLQEALRQKESTIQRSNNQLNTTKRNMTVVTEQNKKLGNAIQSELKTNKILKKQLSDMQKQLDKALNQEGTGGSQLVPVPEVEKKEIIDKTDKQPRPKKLQSPKDSAPKSQDIPETQKVSSEKIPTPEASPKLQKKRGREKEKDEGDVPKSTSNNNNKDADLREEETIHKAMKVKEGAKETEEELSQIREQQEAKVKEQSPQLYEAVLKYQDKFLAQKREGKIKLQEEEYNVLSAPIKSKAILQQKAIRIQNIADRTKEKLDAADIALLNI